MCALMHMHSLLHFARCASSGSCRAQCQCNPSCKPYPYQVERVLACLLPLDCVKITCLVSIYLYSQRDTGLAAMLQVKAFINEAHYYADATIMFPVWPPEPRALYTCTSDHTADTTESLSIASSLQLPANTTDVAVPLVHCPEGTPKDPKEALTGWGIWMAEALWKEIQVQHKERHSALAC